MIYVWFQASKTKQPHPPPHPPPQKKKKKSPQYYEKMSAFHWLRLNYVHMKYAHGRRITFYYHDDAIKWKHFPRYWPFVWGIHRSPVNSPHKDQWRGALIFYLICPWTNGRVNNRDASDLRHHRAHYDVIVMLLCGSTYLGPKLEVGLVNQLYTKRESLSVILY